MPVRELITVPDDTLRKISEPLNKVELNEKKLIKDLFETMYHHNGIGLAAVQVGIHKRIIVLDVSKKDDEKNPLCFINPVIKKISQKTSIYEEGCLSIPNTFIEIERPKICTISYVDKEGAKREMDCDGLLATCIQHEINHLDGKLIIDYLSKIKKDLIIKKLSKQKTSNRVVV